MHCHTSEGSIDSHIPIKQYCQLLKDQGFDGMLVTDHDSYRGYQYWYEHRAHMPKHFTVLRGIEYDTRDAGHFLVIMPDHVHLKLLSVRGLRVEILIRIVHHYGGVLGVAHPYGMRSSSAMFFDKIQRHPDLMKHVDFVEGLNTCELASANIKAQELAKKYGLPCTGGSDAHRSKYVGTAWTEFDRPIRCNNDLITCIKEGGIVGFGGREREFKARHQARYILPTTAGFIAFNKTLSLLFKPYRKNTVSKIDVNKDKIR